MGNDKYGKSDPNKNPYHVRKSHDAPQSSVPNREFINFNVQRVCPRCGSAKIQINHNFCKYCGADLSEIEPIGNSDEVSKQLAITAVTDPDPDVRKEAVDTLGDFGDKKVLGVLTYVLFNDPNEDVRMEAADELGDLHHIYSLDALTKALKDPSVKVRKEAIEGLKKIKNKNKPKEIKEEAKKEKND